MQTKELIRKVSEKCLPLCEAEGLSLWDVTFEKEGRSYMLSVFIDREEGVFVEDCEKISRALDPFLDEKQFDSLPPYTLTVSSAGLERRISRPEHFVWATGKAVDVSFYKARDGVMGLCGESGEAIDIVKKWLAQGHELDKEKLADELGDIAWYLAETAHALDIPLEAIFRGNIEKLKRRYPDGFDAERSINR